MGLGREDDAAVAKVYTRKCRADATLHPGRRTMTPVTGG